MRVGACLLLGSWLLLAAVFLPGPGSWLRGRMEGFNAAMTDIANGEPRIRRSLGRLAWPTLTDDGYGIDLDTGLPLEDTTLLCGTGVDHIARGAENAAYNAAIRAAARHGELDRFSLRHKLRTQEELRPLFAPGHAVALAGDGDALRTKGGMTITYRRRSGERTCFEVTGHDADLTIPWLVYPPHFADLDVGGMPADGPFEAVLADEQTTVILRDGRGFAWIVDLPTMILVQLAGPLP